MNGKHLPECIYTPERFDTEQNIVWAGKPCICEQLRACERRVWRDPILAVAQKNGYTEALIDAREAVESMVIETAGNSAATVNQAVAAIDALRHE